MDVYRNHAILAAASGNASFLSIVGHPWGIRIEKNVVFQLQDTEHRYGLAWFELSRSEAIFYRLCKAFE